MKVAALTVVVLLTASVNAHFRLLYPEPRGSFIADIEPNFCGGYDNAVTNRSTFPLSGGVFSVSTSHPDFTVGVLLSTAQNPNTWDSFNSANGMQQYVRDYAKEEDAGTFCIPLDIAAANIPGAVDGANVTIQIVFAGGDGNLYQCADLTLSNTFTTPGSMKCENVTTEHADGGSSSTSAAGATTTSPSSGSSGSTGQMRSLSGLAAAAVIGLAGLGIFSL